MRQRGKNHWDSKISKKITGIDISDVGINHAKEKATQIKINNTEFLCMSAEEMTFEKDSFYFIFGGSIIHHLDLDRSHAELSKVLRADGVAVFIEPLGHNPLRNIYRKLTPSSRTPDEHPLKSSDFEKAQKYFNYVDYLGHGLFTLAYTPLKNSKLSNQIFNIVAKIDKVILTISLFKRMASFPIVTLKEPKSC